MSLKSLSPIKVGQYTLPTSDGSNGQVLTTDGSGNVTFANVTAPSDKHLSGLSFNTSNGVLTATVSNGSNVTVDLDGRYLKLGGGTLAGDIQMSSNNLKFDQAGTRSWNISAGSGNLNITSGDGVGSVAIDTGLSVQDNSTFGGTLNVAGNTTFSNWVHWDLNSGEYAGDPRAVVMGYSGGNYGSIGYNIAYTSTSNSHTRVFGDIPTRMDLYDGILLYSSATGSAGTAISWTELLQCQSNKFEYKSNDIFYNGYSSLATFAGNLFVDGGNITIDPDANGNALVWKEGDSTTIAGQLRSYANRGDIYLYKNGTKTTEISSHTDSFIPALHIGGTTAASGGALQVTGNANFAGNVLVGNATQFSSSGLSVESGNTNVVASFKSNDNQAWIAVRDDDSGTYGALFGTDTDAGHDIVIADKNATNRLTVDGTGRVGIGPGTTGAPYDSTTYLHVKGTTRSVIQQSSTSDAYYMFGDAGANNVAWLGYNHATDQLSLHTSGSTYIDGNTSFAGDVTISKSTPKLTFNNLAGGGLDPRLTASGTNFTISTTSITPLTIALDTGDSTFTGNTQAPKFIAAQGTTYANGYQLTRTGHDTYRICLGNSEGLRIVNETDGSREELAFAGNGNATFAKDVTLTDGVLTVNDGNNYVKISEGSNSIGQIELKDSSPVFVQGWGTDFRVAVGTYNNHALTINSSKNATLAGNLTISNSSPALNLTDTDNSSNIAFSSVGGALVVNSTSDQVYQIGGTEKFRIGASLSTFAEDVRLSSYTGSNTGGGGQTTFGALSIFENSGTAALFLGVKDASYANRGWSFKATEVGVNSKLELIEHGLAGTRLTIASGGDATFAGNVNLADNKKIQLGASQDLKLYHDGSHSYIQALNTGDLYVMSSNDDVVIQAADDVFIYTQGGEDSIICRNNSGVELYYDNSKKFETTSTGVSVTGHALPSADSTYNLGSDAIRWASIFADGIATSTITPNNIRLNGDFDILNKAQTSYIDFATRDTTGTEVVYNLSNVGSITTDAVIIDKLGTHGRIRAGGSMFLGGGGSTSLVQFSADAIPDADSSHDLGSGTRYWKNAYIDTVTTTGDITVGGNINVTGDINSISVTDLDVTDKTITVGKGQNAASSAGSGIAVERSDSTNPSLLWNQSTDRFDFNTGVTVGGQIHTTGAAHIKGALFVKDTDSTANHVQARSNGTEGYLTLSNGSNWGFIARGPGNDPRIGAWYGGVLKIEGFHSSDGATGSNAIDFAQFQFGNDHFQMNAATSTFAGAVTVEGGTLELGKADTASGHINAKELMTFNIDTDNDDTNRYFAWYKNSSSGSGTELFKIEESGDVTVTGGQVFLTANNYAIENVSGKYGVRNSSGDYGGNDGSGVYTTPQDFFHIPGTVRVGPKYATSDRDYIRLIPSGIASTIEMPNENAYIHNNAGNIVLRTGAATDAVTVTGSNTIFAGKINAKGGANVTGFTAATINAFTATVSSNLYSALRIVDNTAASTYWDIGAVGGASPDLKFFVNASTAPKFTLSTAGNATFTGIVSVPTGKSFRLYNAAGNGWGELTLNETDNKIQFNRGIQPSGNEQADQLLGNTSKRWHTVYAKDGNFSGNITASSFIKSGGTSSQFLMADGSVSTSSGSADNLGNHTATQALNMGGNNITNAGGVQVGGELDFTGNGDKFMDVFTLANGNTFTLRHHNPSGNLFETGFKTKANGATELYHDGSVSVKTRSDGFQAKAFMDSDNTAYYLNPAETGTSLNVAGSINLPDNKMLLWGGNSIVKHTGSSTQIGDNTSGSVLTLAGGDADFTGNVEMQSGNSVGKFAVMASAPHGSFDFYNNGTSYFNGQVTIDATCLFSDNEQLKFGGSSDFLIYHNSTTNVNHVSSQLDRQLSINANIIQLTNQANSSTYLKLESDKATLNTGLNIGGSVGQRIYAKNYGSLSTTGNAVAGLLSSGNGSSASFVFETAGGGSGGYQRVVFSCINVSGTWVVSEDINEGGNRFDVISSGNGSTVTFTFKARSSTQSYSPKVNIKAFGHSINETYF